MKKKKTIYAASVAGTLLAPICASPAAAQGTFDLKTTFGAACDGVHDDTVMIQEWLNQLAPNVHLTAPAGVCVFSAPLRAPFARGYDISGAGPYATVLRYVGPSTTADLLTISDTGHGGETGVSIRDFRITSQTRMTGGYAFHAHGLFDSIVSNVVLDGISEGNGNLCGGYWFDGAGGVDLQNPNAYSKQFCGDAVLVNAALGGTAELRIIGGNIGPGFVGGLHMAGGFGGFRCDGTNIYANAYNLLIDNAIVQAPNREFDQGSTCALDSAFVSGAMVSDPLASGGTVDLAGWVASSQTGSGIDIRQWKNGDVEIHGDKVYNNCLDGVYVEDPTAHVFLANSVAINANGNSHINRCQVPAGRGWGVNASLPTANIVNCSVPWGNTAGALSPNVATAGQCM
jgi:hypothetical protein